MKKLYCKSVFWPEGIKLPAGAMLPEYTNHALTEAKTDRYGEIKLPEVIRYNDYEVIEAEVDNGRVTKVVLKADYDDRRAVRLVVRPQQRKVVTCWTCLHTDTHATLDASRYDKA